jgi:molybdate transport system ATP-binding protein
MKSTTPRLVLSLRDATFRLGERLVFQNTTWNFRRGEHWAILGPNGSGKSLFGDALRGRIPLVGGQLRYHFSAPPGLLAEEAIGHVSFEDRKSGVSGTVVQSRWNSIEQEQASLVREFLSFEQVMDINPFEVGQCQRRARRQFEHRLRRSVSLLQICPFLNRTLLSLSNGERQRVQLARAFCQPLRLLILDEPYLGLDATTREQFHRLLERLMSTSLRVLLITTRAEDLPVHITHLLYIEDFQVVRAGPRINYKSRIAPLRGDRRIARAARTKKARTIKPIVQLRNVSVRYGTTLILNKLNWTVYTGESWALLGPNGSGKSTLLSLVLGDNPQVYSNDVTVFGRRLGHDESIWELKKTIGFISPELQLHFDTAANCFEVVASGFHETIGLFQQPTSHQRAATRRWLQRFALLEFTRTPLFALSAGLQRMVLIARAMVKNPSLLILDEPCQSLDETHRKVVIETVDKLIRSGVTVIYVTHRMDEIPQSINRIKRL